MENLMGYIATGVVTFIVGWLLRFWEPKEKLVFWQPHYFIFNVKDIDPPITLITNSISIQNFGRRTAKKIEIIFDSKPDFYGFYPKRAFDEETLPKGEYVLTVESLGPKEWFTLQFLSYRSALAINHIRSSSGPAKPVALKLFKQLPLWLVIVIQIFTVTGLGFSIYWVIKAILFISQNIL